MATLSGIVTFSHASFQCMEIANTGTGVTNSNCFKLTRRKAIEFKELVARLFGEVRGRCWRRETACR